MMIMLLVYLVLLVPISANVNHSDITNAKFNEETQKNDLYITRSFDWVSDKFYGFVESLIPDGQVGRSSSIEARKHKHKYKPKKKHLSKFIFPLIVGFLLLKSVVLPLTLKALAILSGKAILLSMLSLILSAIIGLRQMANNGVAQKKMDMYSLPLSKYRRKEYMDNEELADEELPYRYYADRMSKRK